MGYNLVPLVTIGNHWWPLSTIPYHQVPFSIIENHLVPLGTISYHWVPLGTIRYHWVPSGTIGYPWVPFGTIGDRWEPLGRVLVRFCEFEVCQEANPDWLTEWVTKPGLEMLTHLKNLVLNYSFAYIVQLGLGLSRTLKWASTTTPHQ